MTESRTKSPPPLQLLIAFDSMRLRGMSPTERRHAVTCLATLLLEASGAILGEREDDQR
jgi:hypothetical protein